MRVEEKREGEGGLLICNSTSTRRKRVHSSTEPVKCVCGAGGCAFVLPPHTHFISINPLKYSFAGPYWRGRQPTTHVVSTVQHTIHWIPTIQSTKFDHSDPHGASRRLLSDQTKFDSARLREKIAYRKHNQKFSIQ